MDHFEQDQLGNEDIQKQKERLLVEVIERVEGKMQTPEEFARHGYINMKRNKPGTVIDELVMWKGRAILMIRSELNEDGDWKLTHKALV